MFSVEELREVMRHPRFLEDYGAVRQVLLNERLHHRLLSAAPSVNDLLRFVECTLASACRWRDDGEEAAAGRNVCRIAAELAECLAHSASDPEEKGRLSFRASILYELAALPALSASMNAGGSVPEFLEQFFARSSKFAKLQQLTDETAVAESPSDQLADLPLAHDATELWRFQQNVTRGAPAERDLESNQAAEFAKLFSLRLSATDFTGFAEVVRRRVSVSTRSNTDSNLFETLSNLGFPAELLPAQLAALQGGLLSPELLSWGFAAPTGSGKTFISRLLIAQLLSRQPDCAILYIVPSRALVTEVSASLGEFVKGLGKTVLSLSAQLVDLDTDESAEFAEASVIVMTPEKADMLLRLDPKFISDVALVIVDEAHHIEVGTRGVLLEMYLWRLRRMLKPDSRFVFLSAVAPNIQDICRSVSERAGSVVVTDRPTRMRAGVYRRVGKGVASKGLIEFSDGTHVEVVSRRAELNVRRGIAELASFLTVAGPVLTVAKGKAECEKLATAMQEWLSERGKLKPLTEAEVESSIFKELDSSLEREMYTTVPMRRLLKNRIAYHHAGLPPRVRRGVEAAIRAGLVDQVFATTTLAEGVNFPFSSVVVQSLAMKDQPEKGRPARYNTLTPRVFWNIAGRAGRPGFDREGQVVLFEPSLGLDHINAVLGDYLDPSISGISPVRSALATSLTELECAVAEEEVDMEDLGSIKIAESVPRKVRGAINLIRVGLVHRRAAGLKSSPEDLVESTFASQFLTTESLDFARKVVRRQEEAIVREVRQDEFPPLDVIAKLGLSLETLLELKKYVTNMFDDDIAGLSRLFFGGSLNMNRAQHVLISVATRMTELEGRRMQGVYGDLLQSWISGVPFTVIKDDAGYSKRIEDLISVIYSQIQFLLPWGLYATDTLVELEAAKRQINYDGTVKRLAYLADAGVPSLDALRLVNLDFERVDATRLSERYQRTGGTKVGTDIVGWVSSMPFDQLITTVSGIDQRRVAFAFEEQVSSVRRRFLGI